MGGYFLLLIFVYLAAHDFLLCVNSAPDTPANCTSPAIRVEWYAAFPSLISAFRTNVYCRSTFTDEEKAAYFDAERCLLKAPAQTNIPDVTSRYEDLVSKPNPSLRLQFKLEHQVGVHSSQSDIYADEDTWHMTGQYVAPHNLRRIK